MASYKIRQYIKGDTPLYVIFFIMSLFSLLMVYSATGNLAFRYAGGQTWYYLLRHFVFILVGFACMLLMPNLFKVKHYARFTNLAVVVTVAALILAFIQQKMTGAVTNRSVDIAGFSLQPAEMAKITIIMFAARMCSVYRTPYQEAPSRRFPSGRKLSRVSKMAFWWVVGIALLVCVFIGYGDFSTALLIASSVGVLLFAAGSSYKQIFIVIAVGVVFLLMSYFVVSVLFKDVGRFQTVKARVDDYIFGDDDAKNGTTQADYARLAVYEGGVAIWGKGIGNNDVSNYMEAAYNDFIYAIVIEETNFFGAISILFVLLWFLYRGMAIAMAARKSYASFLVLGLTCVYVTQAFINMMVSTGLLPVTGQPLPWVSMGGTSVIFIGIAIGMIHTVSYRNKQMALAVEGDLSVEELEQLEEDRLEEDK